MCARVNREEEHSHGYVPSRVHTVYTDLDGTLLGPGGSLFAVPGGLSTEPAMAVASLAPAGIDLVVVSGRTRDQIREVARILGAKAYIAELGGLLVYREGHREVVVHTDGVRRGSGSAAAAIARSGAAGFLLDAYRGRLEPHTPWAMLDRECSVLLRGEVDVSGARATLARAGYGWLDLLDNGILPEGGARRFAHLDVREVHVYHLVPAGVSKRSAVAADRARRGLDREECVAVGDSASDAAVAPEVAAVFIVANGERAMHGEDLGPNVLLLDRSHGLGFADAVGPLVQARTRASGT